MAKDIITLTLDNDEVVACKILARYFVEEQEYIALLPVDEDGENEDGEVYLYRFSEENGTPVLENIEDDDEYEAAADQFDEWLDEQEYEEEFAELDDEE